MIKTIFKFILQILVIGLLIFIGYWLGTRSSSPPDKKGDLEKPKIEDSSSNKTLTDENREKSAASEQTASTPKNDTNQEKTDTPAEGPKDSDDQKSPIVSTSAKIPEADRLSYTIFTKAYLDRKNAEELLPILEKKGYSPYIVSIWDNNKKLWHAVRVGYYPNYDAATKAAQKFSLETRLPAKVLALGSLEIVPSKLFEEKAAPDDSATTGSKNSSKS